MPRVPLTPRKRRKRSWRKRLVLATALLLAAAVATPFVFTGSLVRLFLARSSYRNLPLRFSSATLRPTGLLSLGLTLRDVAIDDTQDAAGKPLFTAASVQIGFGLHEVRSQRLREVVLDNADVTLRPGAETPLTLLRLMTRPDGPHPPGRLRPLAVSGPGPSW
jgi:hypothetical protein